MRRSRDKGMTAGQAWWLEMSIIGLCLVSLFLVFQPFSIELFGVGAVLVVVGGERLENAIDSGFERAWSSIRDSNLATVVVCMILLVFGRSFGASMVQGFAWTLLIGVAMSMFTAVIVTRTLVKFIMTPLADAIRDKNWLLGL